MITAREIATKKFEKASFGGYRVDDVDNFLNEIAAELEALEEQNNTLNKKLEMLAEKVEEYRSEEESLHTALLGAQKLGDSIVRESKSKAEIIVRDATIKADRAVSVAHEQVEREKMIYLKLQKDVSAFKSKLLAIYRQHLEIISSLPDDAASSAAAENAARAQNEEAAERQEIAKAENEARAADSAAAEDFAAQSIEPDIAVENADVEQYEVHFEGETVIVSQPETELVANSVEGGDYDEADPRGEQGGKFDEYYEDFDDEDSKLDVSDGQKKSRFGTLKFGSTYDLKRE